MVTSQIERNCLSPLFFRGIKGVLLYRSKFLFSGLENRDVPSSSEGVMLDITCAFSTSSDDERMTEDWIRICAFLDITSKKGKVPTLYEDVT